MGIAKKLRMRADGPGPSVEGGAATGRPPGLTQTSGTERPDSPTANPTDLADPTARVIQTRG